MDQGEVIALGLALGFGFGWVTAWIQERAYWRQEVQGLEKVLEWQRERSVRLEAELQSKIQREKDLGLALDLELQKIQELRSQLGTLLALESKSE
jgi:hypothetical protein